MNLAFRDMRRNKLRFALTTLGVGMLIGVVISMSGIYEGALTDALSLPRALHADLWVVQERTFGPFAEPSRIPRDTRELIRRMPGVAAAGAVTYQTVQAMSGDRPVRLLFEGYEIGRPGGPANLIAGHGLTKSHYQIVVDASSRLRLGETVPLGPYRDPYTVVGLTRGMLSSVGSSPARVTGRQESVLACSSSISTCSSCMLTPRSSPAAWPSALPSHAPSPMARTSSSPTSRPRRSTRLVLTR